MGAALGASLLAAGHQVRWCAEGRSAASRRRAEALGLKEAPSLGAVLVGVDAVLSIVPPHGALSLAQAVAGEGYAGPYFDLNGISPETAEAVAACFPPGAYGDGAVVGLPPGEGKTATLLMSAGAAERLASFGPFVPQVVPRRRAPTAPRPSRTPSRRGPRGPACCSGRSAGPSPRAQGGSSRPVDRHSPGQRDERRRRAAPLHRRPGALRGKWKRLPLPSCRGPIPGPLKSLHGSLKSWQRITRARLDRDLLGRSGQVRPRLGVAQPGRARPGARGRRFESCRPDQRSSPPPGGRAQFAS